MNQAAFDDEMMERCIRLSATATCHRDLPIACVVARGAEVIAEAINQVRREGDVTRHAELVALSKAQEVLKRKDLSGCTLYTTVEPCPMCSFPIRETRISRVVYAISSPIMGGVSRWNILRDPALSKVMPEAFGPVPEVIGGLMSREAVQVWWKWNPIVWAVIRHRGCFGPAPETQPVQTMPAVPSSHGWLRSLLRFHSS